MQWTSNQLLIFLKEKEIMGKHAHISHLKIVDEFSAYSSYRNFTSLKRIHLVKFLIKIKLEDGKVDI